MIVGIGLDLCDRNRIAALAKRHPDRFPERILHPNELQRYRNAADKNAFLTRRFAAKEACAKALGTGFARGVGFTHIEVKHDELGAPGLQLHGAAADILSSKIKENAGAKLWLTISDERDLAVAQVMIEQV